MKKLLILGAAIAAAAIVRKRAAASRSEVWHEATDNQPASDV